jgi:hypothetical protein
LYSVADLGEEVFGAADKNQYYERAGDLIGVPFPAKGFDSATTAYWSIVLFCDNTSPDTMLNASGFVYVFFTEGWGADKPIVAVTYGLPRMNISESTNWTVFNETYKATAFDSGSGYEVYHIITWKS